MTERPILFTPGNVRAILDGSKSQTRRIVKPEPLCDVEWFAQLYAAGPDNGLWFPKNGNPKDCDEWVQADGDPVRCPYGAVGNRLYVREAHSPCGSSSAETGLYVVFRDGCQKYQSGELVQGLDKYADGAFDHIKWRPSIHMPKWAARLWLEIVEVRVERLQEISEEDAIAEGCDLPLVARKDGGLAETRRRIKSIAYPALWESINGPGSWEQNPWVWAITFKKVAQ